MKKIGIFLIAIMSFLALAAPLAVAGAANNGNGNGNGNGNNGNNGNGNGNGNSNSAATAAVVQTIYLKGSGGNFKADGWQNIFYLGGAEDASDPSVWHIVYSGKTIQATTAMQITFTNGEVFQWDPAAGFSKNGGGNNYGWVIAAPAGWEIAYVDKGNNNQSESYVKTAETGNIQFNISGFHKGTPDEIKIPAALTFTKMVAGEPFYIWAQAKGYDPEAIAAMMSFKLYKANSDGTAYGGAALATAELNLLFSGFTFNADFAAGWYAIVEVLAAEGETFFVQPEPLYIYIEVSDGVPAVTAGLGGQGSGLVLTEFDYDAMYTIINGYNFSYGADYIRKLGYPGLNNNGDIFYIGVTDKGTGKAYASYCAHAGSKNFAGDHSNTAEPCYGYLVAEKLVEGEYGDFLAAFNYIEDNYGDLNGNRHITQTVIWALLGAIDVDSGAFAATNLTAAQKAAVKDVMANYKGYTGNRTIVSLVYMVCENPNHTFEFCQPQLVPIYAKIIFENTLIF